MNFINWLVTSSADPRKVSLAVKGAIVTSGAFVVQALGAACGLGLVRLGIDANWLNQFADIMETLTFALMLLIGSVAAIVGLLRKITLKQWSSVNFQ